MRTLLRDKSQTTQEMTTAHGIQLTSKRYHLSDIGEVNEHTVEAHLNDTPYFWTVWNMMGVRS